MSSVAPWPRRGGSLVVVIALLVIGVSSRGSMQAPAQPSWAGWARCQVDVQGPGYSERRIHTWSSNGGTPTVEGAFRVYPGTWSVVGGGSLQRTQGTQTLVAQWAINATMANAPLAVFVRASDGRMLLQARHAQLRAAGAVAGYQQQIIDGKPQTPGRLSGEAVEFAFPLIDAPATNTSVSGDSAPEISGSVGLMQVGGSRVTASCGWIFGQGAAAPAPPSTLAAVPVPVPPSAVPATPPAQATQAPPAPAAGGGAPPAAPVFTAVPLPFGVPTLPPQTTATTTPNQATTTSPAPPSSAPSTSTATVTPSQATTTSPTQPAASPTSPSSGTIATRPASSRSMVFVASGTFTVPAGITSFVIEAWGAGGGGTTGAPSTCAIEGLVCYDGAAGRGGGSGAYTRVGLSAPIGTTLEAVVGAGGATGLDGGTTEVRQGGRVVALATGGRGDGTGGRPWSGPSAATTAAGADSKAQDGGTVVAGSVAPSASAGGRGGNGGYHLCSRIFGPRQYPCSQPGAAGASGLPGYVLITW